MGRSADLDRSFKTTPLVSARQIYAAADFWLEEVGKRSAAACRS